MAIGPGSSITLLTTVFEVTSFVSDRNAFNPGTNPATSSVSACGFLVDFWVYCTKAFTVSFQFGINGSVTMRDLLPATVGALGATVALSSRIFGSYVGGKIVNTSGADGFADFGIYVRSA